MGARHPSSILVYKQLTSLNNKDIHKVSKYKDQNVANPQWDRQTRHNNFVRKSTMGAI
jgi:hypothetical protein